MIDETIGSFKGKEYRAVVFQAKKQGDIACNHCAFELGKCRAAIWNLGQCYISNGRDVSKNVYYEELIQN